MREGNLWGGLKQPASNDFPGGRNLITLAHCWGPVNVALNPGKCTFPPGVPHLRGARIIACPPGAHPVRCSYSGPAYGLWGPNSGTNWGQSKKAPVHICRVKHGPGLSPPTFHQMKVTLGVHEGGGKWTQGFAGGEAVAPLASSRCDEEGESGPLGYGPLKWGVLNEIWPGRCDQRLTFTVADNTLQGPPGGNWPWACRVQASCFQRPGNTLKNWCAKNPAYHMAKRVPLGMRGENPDQLSDSYFVNGVLLEVGYANPGGKVMHIDTGGGNTNPTGSLPTWPLNLGGGRDRHCPLGIFVSSVEKGRSSGRPV